MQWAGEISEMQESRVGGGVKKLVAELGNKVMSDGIGEVCKRFRTNGAGGLEHERRKEDKDALMSGLAART